MRILFIKPNMGLVDNKPYFDRGRMEPLTFAVLKGITPKDHEVELCDDRFEAVPYRKKWDIVGINTEIYTARRAYEIADKFRSLGAKVILGGFHTTLLPEESLAHADAIVTGDGDEAWPQILLDVANKSLKRVYTGCKYSGRIYEGIKTDWSIFHKKSYLPVALTQFSRGCSNKCEYCATGNIYCGSFVHRPIKETIEELAKDGRKFVFFADDNIVADVPAAKEFFKALIPLKVKWTGQASINFASDQELMDLMLKSGCSGLVIGFESRDPRNLEAMNKRVNTVHGTYDQIVDRIRATGLMVWAAFLLGYDHETAESIRDTTEWAISKKFAFSAFNILMPYPGTPFYERMKAEGRLLYDGKWWLHDDYRFGHTGFRPKNMTAEQLAELGLWARKKHNTIYQIMRRATDRKTNSKDLWSILIYLAYNPLFRDEMLKKHGMMLGYRGFEREKSEISSSENSENPHILEDSSGIFLEGVRKVFTKIAQNIS